MVSCAHGNYPFDKLSRDERICAEKRAIKAINDHASIGFLTTVVEEEYNQAAGPLDPFGAAYAWCCFMCLDGVGRWANTNNYDGDIAYFFETGHKYQSKTNAMMNEIFSVEEMRHRFRYGSHSFVDKKKVRPIQSADMLAWLGATDIKHRLCGTTTMRKDFKALIEGTVTVHHHGEKGKFEEFQDYLSSLPPRLPLR